MIARSVLPIAFALLLVLTTGCLPQSNAISDTPGAGVTVVAARAPRATGHFQAEVFAHLLRRLGYSVAPPAEQQLTGDQFYAAAARGDVDFWANGWFPADDFRLDRDLDDGGRIGDHVEAVGVEVRRGALQGVLIDTRTADARGIGSLSDIAADDDLIDRFDVDGNGVADVFGCEPEWSCAEQLDAILGRYGGRFEQVIDDYATNFDRAVRRLEAGEATLLYVFTPSAAAAGAPPGESVRWIDVDLGEAPPVAVAPGTCTADPCRLGFTPSDIRVVANSSFLADEPAARVLFEQVVIPLADINTQNLEREQGADSQEAIAAAAESWILERKALVLDWLTMARRAADE